jgi:hypothetical protein
MAEALDELADTLPPPAEAAADVGDADVGVAEAPAVAEPPSSSEPDPLDKLLADYDRSTGANGAATEPASDFTDDELARLLGEDGQDAAAREQREQEFAAAQQRYASESAQSAIEIAQRDAQLGELQQTVGQLQQAIAQEQARQFQARQLEAFNQLAADEQSKLKDIPDIADNHVETFLRAEATRDPELVRAFDAKWYQPPGPLERARIAADIQAWAEGQARLALQLPDPRARVLAQQNIEASMRQMFETAFPDPATVRANGARYLQRALDLMHKDARRPRIDVDATEGRLAVVAAMKGASGKPSAEPPPNFSQMSDGEFSRTTKQLYGF